MRFQNAVAVVTGAASGIGLAITRALLDEGATVLATDVAEPPAGFCPEAGSRLVFSHHDVSSEDSWKALFTRLHAQSRGLDVLVNCAGIMRVADMESTDAVLFDRILSVNAKGAFLGCQQALRAMLAGGRGGAIVNVASTTAIKPAPWVAAYAASKAAVVNLTRSVALQGAQSRPVIRCNAVLPGVVLTPMVQSMVDAAPDKAAALAGLESQHPIGRLLNPEEVASAVLFLASSQASGITGAGLVVDGGMTAG